MLSAADEVRVPDPAPVPNDEDLAAGAAYHAQLTKELIRIKCALRGMPRGTPEWKSLVARMLPIQKILKEMK